MKKKPLIIAGVALAGVAASLGFYWPFGNRHEVLRLPGIVEIQEVRLSSRVGGRVKSTFVKEGVTVTPGQKIVAIELPEIEAQRDQYARRREAAYAGLEKLRNGATPETKAAANAAVAAAEAKLVRVKAQARPEELVQAREEWNALKAEAENARVDYDRERFLQGKNVSSDSKLDQAKAIHLRFKAQAEAARARLKLLEAGPRKEDIAEAEALVAKEKSQRDLTIAPARSEEIAEAEAKVAELDARIRELDSQLAEAVIIAPEAAVVEVLSVRPGDVVAANQPVARVLRADDVWIKAYVPSTKLGLIRVNQAVELTIDSHPGRRFQGTIDQIATAGEFTPRNVQTVEERANQVFAIKVRVNDKDGIFKSGMAADVIVQTDRSNP